MAGFFALHRDTFAAANRLDVDRDTGDVAASMRHVELHRVIQGIDAE